MVKKFFFLFLSIIFMAACGPEGSSSDATGEIDIPQALKDEPLKVEDGKLVDIVQSFSSPVEMAALLKDVGVPFNIKYLVPADNDPDDYNTNFKKALGLGILSVDLGYLNIYNKTSSIISYITKIKRLADGIQVGQYFDFQAIKRLATEGNNIDSLMFLSVNSFNQMDAHLREHSRGNLSTLIVTGMWIEGLYIASQVYKDAPNKSIAERIGEQKIILNELFLILTNYENDQNFAELIEMLKGIKQVYDQIEITFEVGEPEAIEKDGMLIIVQNEESNVHISEEQLKSIISKAEQIRNKLIDF